MSSKQDSACLDYNGSKEERSKGFAIFEVVKFRVAIVEK